MNNDRAAGAWHQIKGKVKAQWGKLTDDDLKQLEGDAEQLAGKLQERYGIAREQAEREAKDFRSRNNWKWIHRPAGPADSASTSTSGTLRSGGSGKRVRSRKQAIAIGLSEARRAGAQVPRKR